MLLVTNGKVRTMVAGEGELTDVLIQEGKIIKTGVNLAASLSGAEVEVLDAGGRTVTPGLVESHCHLGMAGLDGSHINEIINPLQSGFRAIDAMDFASEDFELALSTGVTTIVTGPGSSNLMGGTFMALKSAGDSIRGRIIAEELSVKMALGENPKMNYSKMGRSPATRLGAAALIREQLYKAHEYWEKWKTYQERRGGEASSAFAYDLHLHSLMRVFEGMRVKIHAHQANDILTALRIVKEFGLSASIDHCTEGYKIFDELKASSCKVILGPVVGGKSKVELRAKRYDAAALFEEQGIPFGLATDFPVIPLEGLLMQACVLVKHGLSREGALRALTADAADAVDLSSSIGSLEAGKDADLVIWEGDPLETRGEAHVVIIDGKVRFADGRVVS